MLPSIKRVDQDWLPTIFNDFFNHGLFPAHFNAFTSPAINIKETDKMFEIDMAVPGMTKDDFQVQVSEHRLLQISVQKKEEKQARWRHIRISENCCSNPMMKIKEVSYLI